MMKTEIMTVGNHQQQAEQQHLAQRHAEQAGQGERADAGNDHHDAALQPDGHGRCDPAVAVIADPLGQVRGRAARR